MKSFFSIFKWSDKKPKGFVDAEKAVDNHSKSRENRDLLEKILIEFPIDTWIIEPSWGRGPCRKFHPDVPGLNIYIHSRGAYEGDTIRMWKDRPSFTIYGRGELFRGNDFLSIEDQQYLYQKFIGRTEIIK